MRYLIVNEVLEIYSRVMQQTGGATGIRDLGALESDHFPRKEAGAADAVLPARLCDVAEGFSQFQGFELLLGHFRGGVCVAGSSLSAIVKEFQR